MVSCNLRWSRWELCFVSVCHLMAAISVVQAEVLRALEFSLIVAVLVSYLLHLHARIRCFCVRNSGVWRRASPQLLIGEQSARLDWRGETREVQLPRVVYCSEFLLVLSFRPEPGGGAVGALRIALWPDSLARSENRRLRRYLRFDLPANLSGD